MKVYDIGALYVCMACKEALTQRGVIDWQGGSAVMACETSSCPMNNRRVVATLKTIELPEVPADAN